MRGPARAVLYDYGNVLADWQPRALYTKLIDDPVRLDWFLSSVCTMAWHMENDRGVGMDANIESLAQTFPAEAELIRAWKSRFSEMVVGEIPGAKALIEQLAAQGTPLYCLTNMPAEVVEDCFGPFDFRRHFTDIIVSGVEKLAKPDPAIFALTLKRMGGLAAEDVFFADDNRANIEAAAAMGFRAHLFTDSKNLEAALRADGVLRSA